MLDNLEAVSKEVKQPVAAVALRWLLHKHKVDIVLIGARTVQQLQNNLKAASFTLSDEQVRRLDKASDAPLPYPFNLQQDPPLDQKS